MAAAAGGSAAVCDESPARLLRARPDFPGVRTFGSFEEVLLSSEIEAVALATPGSTHFPLDWHALEAGKDVVAEQPITNSLATARELIELNPIKTGKRPTLNGRFGADAVDALVCAEKSVRFRDVEVSIS
jgi:predicted dehydrogenase